jgi:hypothetical protein
MIDRDVLERAATIIGCKVNPLRSRQRHWKQAYVVRVRGAGAVEWMTALRPFLGARRQAQVDRAIACYEPRSSYKLTPDAAREALLRLRRGESVKQVARRFGVTDWCIYDLRLGRTHKHLQRD